LLPTRPAAVAPAAVAPAAAALAAIARAAVALALVGLAPGRCWAEADAPASGPQEVQRDFTSADGAAEPLVAHILREPPPASHIDGLRLSSMEAPVVFVSKGNTLRPITQVAGYLDHPGWALSARGGQPIHLSPFGRFSLTLYLNSRIN
jgi:hypothetical protein